VQEYEIPLPQTLSETEIIEKFESRCLAVGLVLKRLDLKKYPGCTHWHLVKSGAKGTLEATFWPEQKRLWFSVHDNRCADWHGETIKLIKAHWL
jgi:hypothetical protein